MNFDKNSLGEYSIDFTQVFAAFDQVGSKEAALRETISRTNEAYRQMARQALEAGQVQKQRLAEQVTNAILVRESISKLTAQLQAQEKAEQALNRERDKGNVSAKRIEEIKQALALNQQQQKSLKEEIERSTAAYNQLAAAATKATTVRPATPPAPSSATGTGASAAGPDSSEVATAQQQAKTAVVATTQALGQQAAVAQQAAAAAQDTARQTVSGYRLVAQAVVDLDNKLAAATQEQQAARSVVLEQVAALRQLRVEQKEMNAEKAKTPAGEDTTFLDRELARNVEEQQKLNQLIAESRIAYQQEQAIVAGIRNEIRQAGNEQKLAAAAVRDSATAERETARQAKEAADAVKQRAAEEKKAAEAADKQARAAGLLAQYEQQLADLVERRARATTRAEVLGYNKQIKDAKDQLAELKGEADNAGPTSGGFFGNLIGKAGAATAAFFATSKVLSVIKEGINDFKAISGIEATFTAVAGSAQAGAQELAFITQQANKLGLELIPTAKAYTGLFAAAKEANFPLEQTRGLFIGLTDAGRVLGRTQGEVESALRAVEQMISKGTVSSQELKLQLGDALPGAFGLAAKAAGLSTAAFTKQLESGKILATDFLPKLAKQLRDTYSGATADAATQATANLGRINTFLTNQSAKLGAVFAPAIKGLADLVSGSEASAQKSERLVATYDKQNASLRNLQTTVTPLLARYEELNGTANRNTMQQRELDTVIQQLAKTVPGAVTQFDAYGKAIGLNSEAIRTYLRLQEDATRYANRKLLADNSEELRELVKQADALQIKLANTEVDKQTGLKRRRMDILVDGDVASSSLLSQEDSDKITRELTAKLAEVQDNIRGNLEYRQRLRGKSPLLPTGNDAANDKAIQGLIEKQQKLIKDLQDRQKAAVQENQGNGKDFLFGKGELNQQLEAAQKELDRLLGKVDKSAAAAGNRLLAALRALESERRKLSKELASAELDEVRDQGQAKAAEQLKIDQAAIRQIEQNLKEREAAVKKAGGKGTGADGVIDGKQREMLSQLQLLAIDRFNRRLIEIAQETADRLFSLRADSDAKEIDEVNRKYDKMLQAQLLGQSAEFDALDEAAGLAVDRLRKRTQEELAIEEARQRELAALKYRQQQRDIDQTAQIAANNVRSNIGEVYGEGTGISVIEAKQAEQEALLLIEKKAAEESLKNTQLLTGKQADLERSAAQLRLRQVENSLKDIEREKAKHKAEDFMYKLVLGEEDSPAMRAQLDETVSQVISAINATLEAQIQASQAKIDAKTREIDELQRNLDRELQYNKEGSASSIANTRAEIEAAKSSRRQALEDQKKAAKQQQLIQDLTTVSSIATAVANIISGWSTVPFVGSILGIGAAAAMVTAFVATKAKAKQAAQSNSEGFYRGGYTGLGNPREESQALGKKSYTYHKGEFVFPHEHTSDFRHALFEPLLANRPNDIRWDSPKIQALLPDYSLPKRLKLADQKAREQAMKLSVQHQFAPMQEKFDALQKELSEIKKHVATTANKKDVIPLGDNKTLIIDPQTNSETVRYYEGLGFA